MCSSHSLISYVHQAAFSCWNSRKGANERCIGQSLISSANEDDAARLDWSFLNDSRQFGEDVSVLMFQRICKTTSDFSRYIWQDFQFSWWNGHRPPRAARYWRSTSPSKIASFFSWYSRKCNAKQKRGANFLISSSVTHPSALHSQYTKAKRHFSIRWAQVNIDIVKRQSYGRHIITSLFARPCSIWQPNNLIKLLLLYTSSISTVIYIKSPLTMSNK